ncbi:uncharacterized protein [Solanum lycopersicum]|uniref:uncharacterized protein n=1 Tax=Solanum lycopersicum TaxID=4081 RepID=UPI0002BC9856|nr:uncharacterized protein LOC101253528 [Solanum lycopersicum]
MLGNKLPDSRVIEKLLVTLPEKFEPTIASLENTNDLSRITSAGLPNALQAATKEKNSPISILRKEESSSLQMLEKVGYEMPKNIQNLGMLRSSAKRMDDNNNKENLKLQINMRKNTSFFIKFCI